MEITSIYDNGGKTLDRYTIILDKLLTTHKGENFYNCLSCSENGLGVFMWTECQIGRHLGKKIKFNSLSPSLQKLILNALKIN